MIKGNQEIRWNSPGNPQGFIRFQQQTVGISIRFFLLQLSLHAACRASMLTIHATELECLVSLSVCRGGSWHHGLRNSAAFAAAFFAPPCFENWGKTSEIREKMQSGNPWEFLRKPLGIHQIPTANHRNQHTLFFAAALLACCLQGFNAETAGLQTEALGRRTVWLLI